MHIQLTLKPKLAGDFRYQFKDPDTGAVLQTLTAHHGPIETIAVLSARSKAAELLAALQDGADTLDRMGLDSEAILKGTGRAGLITLFFAAELWVGVVNRVTLGSGETGEMPAAEVYKAFLAVPGLFFAWESYSQEQMASASEGNAFTLSPDGSGTGAGRTARAAVH